MAATTSRENIIAVIREELAKYAEREFGADEDLIRDIHLHGDDFTAAALSVEKRLGVKIGRPRYGAIHNVNEFADAIVEAVKERT